MSNSFREDWRRGTALLVALLALGIIGGALVYWFTPAFGQTQPKPLINFCASVEDREIVRTILQRSVDNGLQDQVTHLFEQWMRDSTDQPRRAVNGSQTAIIAYIRARKFVVGWNPPVC
jgi:hypothetical protein